MAHAGRPLPGCSSETEGLFSYTFEEQLYPPAGVKLVVRGGLVIKRTVLPTRGREAQWVGS